jgi:hypothetical protein
VLLHPALLLCLQEQLLCVYPHQQCQQQQQTMRL